MIAAEMKTFNIAMPVAWACVAMPMLHHPASACPHSLHVHFNVLAEAPESSDVGSSLVAASRMDHANVRADKPVRASSADEFEFGNPIALGRVGRGDSFDKDEAPQADHAGKVG
jgi:hypothetical protein